MMFYLSGKGSGMEANTERERQIWQTGNGRQEKTQGDKRMGYNEGAGLQGGTHFASNVCTVF